MPCAFPRLEIAFTQPEKFKRNVINLSSLNAKRTVKPDDAAQTLVPSTLKMAAWSRLPVAIRLNGVSVMSMMKIYTVVGTLCQHTLHQVNQHLKSTVHRWAEG